MTDSNPTGTAQESPDRPPVIMMVDDDRLIRKAMQRVLTGEFQVLLADGKAEAERILGERADICLVISDCRMEANTSGIELLEALARERPGITRLLVSGSLDASYVRGLVERQVVHAFLPKPWDKSELLEAVRAGCARSSVG